MKLRISHIALLILIAAFSGCDLGNDCFSDPGTVVREKIEVAPFSEVEVNEDIELVIAKGDQYEVVVEAGKNIQGNVTAEVVEGRLFLLTDKPCALSSGNSITRIYVTTPVLTEIRSFTQYAVRSQGVLAFDRLKLRSVVLSESYGVATGEFFLEVDTDLLSIEANELANFEISGRAERLNLRLVDGTVRAYMPDLEVADAVIYHRSAQDITIRPSASVTGALWSTGDLILLSTPPVVAVEENYTGKVIYN